MVEMAVGCVLGWDQSSQGPGRPVWGVYVSPRIHRFLEITRNEKRLHKLTAISTDSMIKIGDTMTIAKSKAL